MADRISTVASLLRLIESLVPSDEGQQSGKGPGIGFLKEVLKVEAGRGAGKSPPPCACTAFWPGRDRNKTSLQCL
jgi:hypothetical protein